MPSLELDIRSNDDFAKSALKAADALDAVAAKEKQVNALAEKLGSHYKAAASYANQLSPSVAAKMSPVAGATKKDTSDKKQAEAAKKRAAQEKKEADERKKSLETIKSLPAVLAGVAAGVAATAAGFALLAKNAFDSKKESAALVDAFTGKRGPEHLKLLDTLATNLGASFSDVRGKFVEFRQAGLDNKLSFALIKMRADLMAVGLSAAAADKEVSRVTGAADGRSNIAARMALAEIGRAYRGIGSGAKAATHNAETFEGAQNKISNAVGEALAGVWKEIAPSIGKAAHAVADFAVDFLNSADGQAMIAGAVDAFKALTAAVTSENLMTGINVLRAAGAAIATVFEVAGKAIAFAAVKGVEAIDFLTEKFGKLMDGAIDLFPAGAAIIDGLIDGITAGASKAVEAVAGLAKDIAGGFADALGIKSPSKVFEEYGKNTVAGFQQGEERAMAVSSMPLQQAAVAAPAADGPSGGAGGASIVIENLVVQGGGNAEEIARSIRSQLQRMLQDMSMSRGVA